MALINNPCTEFSGSVTKTCFAPIKQLTKIDVNELITDMSEGRVFYNGKAVKSLTEIAKGS